MGIVITLGVIAAIVFFVIGIYNKIIKLKNNRENAFADIDVQLKMRFDLIPNLVNTVKGYATHEKETLENLTKARTSFLNAGNVEDKINANNQLSGALKTIFAVSENYPDLKANTNFLKMQEDLSDIENKVAASRRFFNSATKEFNAFIEMVPNNIIANMFNFKKGEFFEVENRQEMQDAPKVEF